MNLKQRREYLIVLFKIRLLQENNWTRYLEYINNIYFI